MSAPSKSSISQATRSMFVASVFSASVLAALTVLMSAVVIAPVATAQTPAPVPAPAPAKTAAEKAEEDRIWNLVRTTLAAEPDVRGANLDVVVDKGKVTLRGRVRDKKARKKAEELTKKVKGVTAVVSQLRLLTDQ